MTSIMREGDPMNEAAQGNRPLTQDDNTRFTAVNNASNASGSPATVVVGPNRSLGGPIAASPQIVARPLEDWKDAPPDHPHKRKRTPEPTGIQHHPSPYAQHHIPPQTPQTPRPQVTHPQSQSQSQSQSQPQSQSQSQLHRTTSEVTIGMEEGMKPRPHSMELSYSEKGGDELRHTELRELRPAGSPSAQGPQGSDSKKRKRQFANRTKTGCITCRRRKKKCDEGKPECANCKRGGFVCDGYNTKIAWTRVPTKPSPVTVQPKLDVNGSASSSPSPGPGSSVNSTPGQLLLTGDQHSGSIFPRPVNIEKSGTPPPRGPHQSTQPAPAPLLPQQQQPPIPLQQQPPQEFGIPRTPTFVTSGPLDFSPRVISPPGTYGKPESERHKPVIGGWYDSYAPDRLAQREKCKQACHRFNNALILNASRSEQWRLLIEALRPGGQYEGMPGGIINKVDVETPFHCTYGTNISIGEEVRIGPGCRIIDAGRVTIKSRSVLDGDVKIYTTVRRQDPQQRMGAEELESTKSVTIEEDCWIGGNTTILPGVTIRRGAIIVAGSVVSDDVPPYTVASGNPANIIRGVYGNGT